MPVLEIRAEVRLGQMTRNRCHNDIAITPWWTKIEVESIVLDVAGPCIALQVVNEKALRTIMDIYSRSENYHRRGDLLQPLQ